MALDCELGVQGFRAPARLLLTSPPRGPQAELLPLGRLEAAAVLCATLPADLVLLTPERWPGYVEVSNSLERLDVLDTGPATVALAIECARGASVTAACVVDLELRLPGSDLPTPLPPLVVLDEATVLARPPTVLLLGVAIAARCAALPARDAVPDIAVAAPAAPTCCGLLLVRMLRACSRISSRDLVMRKDSSEA